MAPQVKAKPKTARVLNLQDPRLSEEVKWYLKSRHIPFPKCPPLFKTPEPSGRGVFFDASRVDRVLSVFSKLRHTQGIWAGRVLKPDPWEIAYVIAPVFGWVLVDPDTKAVCRVIRKVHVEVPRKNGKELSVDTPMLTSKGWSTMGALRVGDSVHSPDGPLTQITYVSTPEFKKAYRIRFSAGQEVIAGEEHQWWVHDRYRNRWLVRTTEEMSRDYLLHPWSGVERRYCVEVPRPLERKAQDLLLDPYILGVWLGDGTSEGGGVTNADEDIHDSLLEAGFSLGAVSNSGITRTYLGLQKKLRQIGVLSNKSIPGQYLLGSKAQRLELLRGLMDTDGYAGCSPNLSRCEFSNTRRNLAEGVLFLARSLGFKPTFREDRATLNGKDCGPVYLVSFTAWSDFSPFRLRRKACLLEPRPVRPTRSSTNQVTSIEEVEPRLMCCIQVAHPSHCYLAGEGLVPTHNTTLAGGIACYLTTADGEEGAQVYAAATGKEQARYCFQPVQQIAKKSPDLSPYVSVTTEKVIHKPTGSYFAAVSSLADVLHGANVHGTIIDELHVHKSGALVEALETGMGSRAQPLSLTITTADDSRTTTIYAQRRERIEQLARGAIKDQGTYGVIWAALPTDDPFSEETWKKANPGYGISPNRRFMQQAAREAQQSPAQLASFLRLHLNIRTRQDTRYLSVSHWDMGEVEMQEESLKGQKCYCGMDLASTTDLSAYCLDFPQEDSSHVSIFRVFAPSESLTALNRRTAGSAAFWVQQGWLQLTPGNVTDYTYIKKQLELDARNFQIQEIAFDPWNATQISSELQDEAFNMTEVRQGFPSMSPPTKELQRLLLLAESGKLMYKHLPNGCMRWMVDNFAVELDPAGNVKPSKLKAGDKIDGVVAAIMALSRCFTVTQKKRPTLLGSA